MQFAEISSGGSFFKPADFQSFDALLLEVVRFEHNRPSNYGPKDTAVVDITTFVGGEATGTQQGVMIQQTLLARDLQPLEGKATIQKLEQGKPSKPGQNPPWVWRSPSEDDKKTVIEWATARAAAEKAAADDAPGFN